MFDIRTKKALPIQLMAEKGMTSGWHPLCYLPAFMSLLYRLAAKGALTPNFQPIVDLRGEDPVVLGIEGLVKGPSGTNLESADVLFEYVRRKRAERWVDRICFTRIFEEVGPLPKGLWISLNVHASTLGFDRDLPDFLAAAADGIGHPKHLIVLEVLEHPTPYDPLIFRQNIKRLREIGIRIAVDDLGVGHAGFQRLLEIMPEFVKVDRQLVHGASSNWGRRAVLESLSLLARRLGLQLVAEGVENEEDLATLRELEIPLAQGFHFSRPMPSSALQSFWSSLGRQAKEPTSVEPTKETR